MEILSKKRRLVGAFYERCWHIDTLLWRVYAFREREAVMERGRERDKNVHCLVPE
jgi:hypothetical protein